MLYDLVIIGGGPAGITAGIYAVRKKLKTLVIAKDFFGQIAKTRQVDNWPGDLGISGIDLMKKMESHLKSLTSEILAGDKVVNVEKRKNSFLIKTQAGQELEGKAVLVATGRTEKKLGVPGEQELVGRGVSYCTICDAPFFQDKRVAVIGGGNSALGAALDLAKYASEVFILFKGQTMVADECLQGLIKVQPKIKVFLQKNIIAIDGQGKVESVSYQDNVSGNEEQIAVEGVFINIGTVPTVDFLAGLVRQNEGGEIEINPKNNATSQEGIFAAGDVTDSSWKQFVIAAGEGAKAALAAYNYLNKLEN
ncbi:MAG: FAD-dependent oxidoreductase [Candidatus Pacebacteria bacterium]|nr:FAD-dependent oxidoreductase [Candidatus Paceibacterota bacterium]